MCAELEGAPLEVKATTPSTASAELIQATADACGTIVGDDGEIVTITEDELSDLVIALFYRRADRPRAEPVSEMPAELQRLGLLTAWWLAVDAPTRHYIKRRIGKYRASKLVLNILAFASWQLMADLERAGVSTRHAAVWKALRCMLPGWVAKRAEPSLSERLL